MELRKNNFQLKLREGVIKDFEKVVLSSGMCDLFMPMGFMHSNQADTISYDCSGYTALSQCSIIQAKDALDILEKTFLILNKAGEYLISPSKITLSKDTIFYDEKTGQVKIAYIPMEKQYLSLRENMMDFIFQVERGVEKDNRQYLKKVRDHLDHNNYYIKDIINLIGQLKRDLYSNAGQQGTGGKV